MELLLNNSMCYNVISLFSGAMGLDLGIIRKIGIFAVYSYLIF